MTQRKTLSVTQSAVKVPPTARPMPPWHEALIAHIKVVIRQIIIDVTYARRRMRRLWADTTAHAPLFCDVATSHCPCSATAAIGCLWRRPTDCGYGFLGESCQRWFTSARAMPTKKNGFFKERKWHMVRVRIIGSANPTHLSYLTFDDLQWPMTRVSRTYTFLKLNISAMGIFGARIAHVSNSFVFFVNNKNVGNNIDDLEVPRQMHFSVILRKKLAPPVPP